MICNLHVIRGFRICHYFQNFLILSSFNDFVKYIIGHKIAKLKYFSKVITYSKSPDHVVQSYIICSYLKCLKLHSFQRCIFFLLPFSNEQGDGGRVLCYCDGCYASGGRRLLNRSCNWLGNILTLALYRNTCISSKFPVFHWICVLFILIILVGAELPLCIVVIVVTLSQNGATCFLESN